MDKVLLNLGLCFRANGLISGSEMVCLGLKRQKIKYIFLASDASVNTKKMIHSKAEFYKVEVCERYSSFELSHAIGKQGRVVIGITNENFLEILKK